MDTVGPAAILHDQLPGEAPPNPESTIAAEHKFTPAISLVSARIERAEPATVSPENPQREDALVKLLRMIQVQAVKKSDVVRVDCESHNPQLSQRIVTTLVDRYLAEHLRLNRTSGAHEFLEKQAAEKHDLLSHTAELLRTLKDRTGLTAPETQRELLATRTPACRRSCLPRRLRWPAAEAQVQALREKMKSVPETTVTAHTVGMETHGIELMRNELYRLQMVEQEMASKYTEENVLLKHAHEARGRSERGL